MLWLNLTDRPEEGDVKLFYHQREPDSYRGLLQVWLNGQWGTVSDDSWTSENTDIVCHQLGRTGEGNSWLYCYRM